MPTIRKRGTKWQVQIRRKGFPEFSRSFQKRSDAAEWARHVDRKADLGDLPANEKSLQGLTLAALVTRYRDQVVITKKGAAIETIMLNRFLRDPICRRNLPALCTPDFAAYRDRRLKEISTKSLARQLSPLRNMFNTAQREWGMPLSNPLTGLSLKVADVRRERRLREGEPERLFASAAKCRNKLIAPLIQLAVETAMRRGELLAMRWEDVDLQRRSVTIPEAKNGHKRTIPLFPRAMELLAAQDGGTDKVFLITPNGLRLAWERLVRRAGLPDLHFHDLRHEAISRFFEMGLTVPEMASISGHRDIRMLMRYAHANLTKKVRLKLARRKDESDG